MCIERTLLIQTYSADLFKWNKIELDCFDRGYKSQYSRVNRIHHTATAYFIYHTATAYFIYDTATATQVYHTATAFFVYLTGIFTVSSSAKMTHNAG